MWGWLRKVRLPNSLYLGCLQPWLSWFTVQEYEFNVYCIVWVHMCQVKEWLPMSHIIISCSVPYWRGCTCGPFARTADSAHVLLPCYFWKGPTKELGGFSSARGTGHNYPLEFDWVKVVWNASHKGKLKRLRKFFESLLKARKKLCCLMNTGNCTLVLKN